MNGIIQQFLTQKKGNVLELGHILVTGFFRRMQKFRHATN